jgi:hypothetical protein
LLPPEFGTDPPEELAVRKGVFDRQQVVADLDDVFAASFQLFADSVGGGALFLGDRGFEQGIVEALSNGNQFAFGLLGHGLIPSGGDGLPATSGCSTDPLHRPDPAVRPLAAHGANASCLMNRTCAGDREPLSRSLGWERGQEPPNSSTGLDSNARPEGDAPRHPVKYGVTLYRAYRHLCPLPRGCRYSM